MCMFQLVSSFQTEAQNRTQESEQAKQKLSSLRRMIAHLLKSINDVSAGSNSSRGTGSAVAVAAALVVVVVVLVVIVVVVVVVQ